MKLFVVDEDNQVKVNAPWIRLIPEFNVLFQNAGRKSKQAYDKYAYPCKQLAYIYFLHDFSSPIFSWEQDKKHQEALQYTGLTQEDVTSDFMQQAIAKYEELQYELCRPLKTYKAALKGLTALDAYLENIDFNATDKQGKLLYTPNQFTQNVTFINKAYEELSKLKKRIDEELSQNSGIRGSATMGDREMKSTKMPLKTEDSFEESGPPENEGPKWVDLSTLLTAQ